MRIACLGWGSLVWNPEELPIKGGWQEDGPSVRAEFVRQSNNGRMTLVLCAQADLVPSLWAELSVSELDLAKRALRKREGNPRPEHIASSQGEENLACIPNLSSWVEAKGIDAVIWTNLPPKFGGVDGEVPPLEDVLSYLKALTGEKLGLAREYICKAPRQVNTSYRRAIEQELGWTPSSE